ncbi:unnamed protein product [Triticum turgidum subsp. durum]|uniref:DUF1618 domain-containing protein n=1 Tax=Triticum turgidum subsp. durum TaxID=4567 RepID=A0A9R1RWS6_TRITD|nr:unnamed protein product [Triticum turgidum subsp. durum]
MSNLPAAAASRRSGHRPWVLTDAKCHIGDRDNATTAHAVTSQGSDIKVTFELADPPGVSRCFVHCPSLAGSRYGGDPVVLSSAGAFVLLVVTFKHGPRPGPGAPSVRRRSRGSQLGGRGEHNDFFVYRAGPGAPSLRLLPGIGPYCCPDVVTLAGVMPLGGADLNSKDYAVVFPSLLKPWSRNTNDSTEYILHVYLSDTSKWEWRNLKVSKDHNPEVIMQHEGTRVIFAGRGTLSWVNHWHGILLCNVLDRYPVMRLIQWPVPIPCDLVSRFGMGVDSIYTWSFHDVAISNGVIRFVELKSCRCSDTHNEKGVIGQGWTVTTWNRGIYSNKWDKKFTVKADNVLVTGSSYPKVSGGKRLSWDKVVHGGPTLSLCDDDVVYIVARLDIRSAVAWMLAINIREGTLEAVQQCSADKMLALEPTYVQCALSNYIKQ